MAERAKSSRRILLPFLVVLALLMAAQLVVFTVDPSDRAARLVLIACWLLFLIALAVLAVVLFRRAHRRT